MEKMQQFIFKTMSLLRNIADSYGTDIATADSVISL